MLCIKFSGNWCSDCTELVILNQFDKTYAPSHTHSNLMFKEVKDSWVSSHFGTDYYYQMNSHCSKKRLKNCWNAFESAHGNLKIEFEPFKIILGKENLCCISQNDSVFPLIVRVNREEELYKNKSLVISWSTEDWYRVEMEGFFSSSLTACVNIR